MATWIKCSDHKGQTLWVNFDTVTTLMWRDNQQSGTEICFIGGGGATVRERPEDLINTGQK